MKQAEIVIPEAAAYDPSYRRADTASYWQWTNLGLNERWDQAAQCVNMGWPARCELKDRSARWYGVIFAAPGDFWVYRVFAAGKDRFGRDGRYFFVLIRLRSLEKILSPGVAGLFSYFDTERGLPLKTEPLDQGWQDAAPDEILEAISEELVRGGRAGHWGMDAAGRMTVFSEGQPMPPEIPALPAERTPPLKQPNPPRTRRTIKLNSRRALVGVVLAVSLFLILKPSHSPIKTPTDSPGNPKPGSPETQPPDVPPTVEADMGTGSSQADEGAISEDIPSKVKPVPGDKELQNPDSVPKADEDSPPDPAPDLSP